MARILLVEDHDLVHRLLCDAIIEAGHQADCMTTRAEALAALAPGSHHLAIVDVALPDGSGYDVARRANELGMTVILMSGEKDQVTSLSTSSVQFLAKPFDINEFLRLIADKVRE